MKKKILLLANHGTYVYTLRKEIIEALIENDFEVYLSFPRDENVTFFEEMGCIFVDVNYDRHGKNILQEISLIRKYYKLIKNIQPNVVLTYTIKPNLYGGMISSIFKIPFIVNITGLGTAVEKNSIIQKILLNLYRKIFKNAQTVFMQNKENQLFFTKHNIAVNKQKLIPGSGVNLKLFKPLPYPTSNKIIFIYIARIMKEKGIDQFLDAAIFIKAKNPNTEFHILGFCEEDYEKKMNELQDKGIIIYHGLQKDVKPFIEKSHCTILPTFYPEGMSNVLLENAASARPIITTNRPGCREIVDDCINGYIINQKDSDDLIEKIELFLNLSNYQRQIMGIKGREKVEKEFDRQIVVDAYLSQINNTL